MLISVQSFRLELRAPSPSLARASNGESNVTDLSGKEAGASDIHLLKNLEVVLVIDELRVISFDRYGMKLPSSVAFPLPFGIRSFGTYKQTDKQIDKRTFQ